MLVSSHYRIGGFLYRFVISKYIRLSPFEKLLFRAGNMLPDFSKKLSRLEHSMEGSSTPYLYHIDKSTDSALSRGERMISLGVMCHYMSDFFCSYHAREDFKHRSLIRHLLYELRLDIGLLFLTFNPEKLYKQVMEEDDIEIFEMNNPLLEKNRRFIDIQSIFFSIQKSYHSMKKGVRTDIRFALKAAALATTVLMKDFVPEKKSAPKGLPSFSFRTLYFTSPAIKILTLSHPFHKDLSYNNFIFKNPAFKDLTVLHGSH